MSDTAWDGLLRVVPGIEDETPEDLWEKPLPLVTAGPEWPKGILPELDDWLHLRSEELQVPLSMLAITVLGGIGATVRRRAQVNTGEYNEPLNLYVMGLGVPGERKTAVLNSVRRPLEEIEQHERLLMKDEVSTWREEYAVVKLERNEWRQKVAKPNTAKDEHGFPKETREGNMMVLQAVVKRMAMLEASRPIEPVFFIDDATPEAANMRLAEQDGVITGMASEGALIENVLGRYSSGSANINGLLKGWDGREPIIIDRVGKMAEGDGASTVISRPAINLCLIVQPKMLRKMGSNEDAMGKGFVQRFVYCVPDSRVGYRRQVRGTDYTGVVTWERVCNAINDSLGAFPVSGPSYSMSATRGAVEMFDAAWDAWEKERRPEGSHTVVLEWSSKLESQVWRVAGMVSMLRSVIRGGEWLWTITEEDMQRALAFGVWALEHAKRAWKMFGVETGDNTEGLLKTVHKHLEAFIGDGKVSVTHPELTLSLKSSAGGRFKEKGGSKLVADLLLEAEKLGWVKVDGKAEPTLVRRSYTLNARIRGLDVTPGIES